MPKQLSPKLASAETGTEMSQVAPKLVFLRPKQGLPQVNAAGQASAALITRSAPLSWPLFKFSDVNNSSLRKGGGDPGPGDRGFNSSVTSFLST